jgi:hypothetical protein
MIQIVVFWAVTPSSLVGGHDILKEHAVSIFSVQHLGRGPKSEQSLLWKLETYQFLMG